MQILIHQTMSKILWHSHEIFLVPGFTESQDSRGMSTNNSYFALYMPNFSESAICNTSIKVLGVNAPKYWNGKGWARVGGLR